MTKNDIHCRWQPGNVVEMIGHMMNMVDPDHPRDQVRIPVRGQTGLITHYVIFSIQDEQEIRQTLQREALRRARELFIELEGGKDAPR